MPRKTQNWRGLRGTLRARLRGAHSGLKVHVSFRDTYPPDLETADDDATLEEVLELELADWSPAGTRTLETPMIPTTTATTDGLTRSPYAVSLRGMLQIAYAKVAA